MAIWDVETRRVVGDKLEAHPGGKGGVLHLVLICTSGDQEVALSQGRDGLIKFWKFSNDKLHIVDKWQIDSEAKAFCKASVLMVPGDAGRMLISSSGFEPERVKVWELEEGVTERFDSTREGEGMCMQTILFFAVASATSCVACLYESGNLHIGSVDAGIWLHKHLVYKGLPIGFDMVKSGSKLKGVCCGTTKYLSAFVITDSKVTLVHEQVALGKGELSKDGAGCVKIRSDKRIFVSGGWDNKLRVFNWKELQLLGVLEVRHHHAFRGTH